MGIWHLSAAPGGSGPSYETTPILDGKLVTETAEAAYKAHHQPRVPLLLGSNSADTAGNRVKATTRTNPKAGRPAVPRRTRSGTRPGTVAHEPPSEHRDLARTWLPDLASCG